MAREIFVKWKDTGYTVIVDDDAFAMLSRHTWYIMYSGTNKKPYAFAELYSKKTHTEKRVKRMFYMHQMVSGSFAQTDHENGNTLDNQFHNLRPATYQQNGWNKPKPVRAHATSGSKYKGVRYAPLKGTDRWFASISVGNKNTFTHLLRIGYFDTEDDAARAYNAKALELRGKWAWLNQVPEAHDVTLAKDSGIA